MTHRDIKPENIYLSYENFEIVVKIGDFGTVSY
jgi:serine/threonine protein kinase